MPKSINEEGVKCPFYISMDNKSITCEGITEDCTNTIKFNKREEKEMHRRIFCVRKYENCEIYQMLEKKYEDE